ncbi:MAG: hypothetical protein HY567_01815 [Candidatus Kerfeldbacteria bacterium]|nr:hypothetical protein [Candidatus Kerfeldbacteria bacterium]
MRKLGLLLLLLTILVVPREGMLLPAALMLFAVAVLVVRQRMNPGAMLVLGTGTLLAACTFFFIVPRWTPAVNLPGLNTAIIGFLALSLLSLGFFIPGMWRLRRQKLGTISS